MCTDFKIYIIKVLIIFLARRVFRHAGIDVILLLYEFLEINTVLLDPGSLHSESILPRRGRHFQRPMSQR